MFHGQGNVAHDGGQQVVVIVSDATGQGTMDSSWRICRFRSWWSVGLLFLAFMMRLLFGKGCRGNV
jgi:hypothetical protein